jgi:hypothetical protein
MVYYVLKGEKTNTIYGIYRKYKNRKFVLEQKTEMENLHGEPIKLWVD